MRRTYNLYHTWVAIDRIFYYILKLEQLPGFIPLETFSFCLVDIILAFLFFGDRKKSDR